MKARIKPKARRARVSLPSENVQAANDACLQRWYCEQAAMRWLALPWPAVGRRRDHPSTFRPLQPFTLLPARFLTQHGDCALVGGLRVFV